MDPLDGFADRAWLAWHSLPRDARGRPPSMSSVERSVDPPLPNGFLQKIFNETRRGWGYAGERLAQALQCDYDWPIRARLDVPPPRPTGPVPSRKAAYGIEDTLSSATEKIASAGGFDAIVMPTNPLEAAVQTLIAELSAATIDAVRASAKGHEHERPAHHWGRILRDHELANRPKRPVEAKKKARARSQEISHEASRPKRRAS